MPFSLKYKRLKLKLRVSLAGHSVAMITYCVTKIIPTCSPMIGQAFDTIIIASIDKESGYYDPSKSTSWKVLETVLSHLKFTTSLMGDFREEASLKISPKRYLPTNRQLEIVGCFEVDSTHI